MSDISNRILAEMQNSRLSYGDLSEITGIPKSALQRYATGTTDKIPLDRLEMIASALNVSGAYLMGWDKNQEKHPSPEGQHIGVLYDRADEKDKLLTHSVLDKYDDGNRITAVNTRKRNSGGMVELDVYDEPAAAGLGNYLDAPRAHREQFPAFMVPHGAEFCVRISGDSMEPTIPDKTTVFIHQTVTIDSGKIGIFVLNGSAYCKQLVVDRENKVVRLRSLNPAYEDIIVTAADDLRTVGQVL